MSELAEQLSDEFCNKAYAHGYMEEHSNMALAAQIRAIREQRDLTQDELAELSHMKQERISALENVDYSAWTVKTLRKLARAFDTHLSVSFVPFSKGILDVVNLNKASLQVESREADIASFRERTMIHKDGTWKAIDGSHLAIVTTLNLPSLGPIHPDKQWQFLNKVRK